MNRLQLGLARAGTILLTLFLWVWFGVWWVVSFIGATTVSDDYDLLMARLPAIVQWLFSTPWWVPAAPASILTAFMIWLAWPRSAHVTPKTDVDAVEADPNGPYYTADPIGETLDKAAYNEIVAFCEFKLFPACAAQVDMHEQIIRAATPNTEIANLAIDGHHAGHRFELLEFWNNYQNLASGLTDSPGPSITFERILDCISNLEKRAYRNFCSEADKLAKSIGIDELGRHRLTKDAWEQWRMSHNALVAAYEPIRRDIRFGKLHRLRPSRWGETVEPSGPF